MSRGIRDAAELHTPEYIRERLRYDPETGKLYWREHPSKRPAWNRHFGGKEAFTSHAGGHVRGWINEKCYLAHRVIWAIVHGEWPNGEIDHIDHVRGNNRIDNLRVVAPGENARNNTLRRDNTSGISGVFCRDGKWQASIRVRGRKQHLGTFTDLGKAIAARKAAEREHDFHPNHGMPAKGAAQS